MKTNTNQKWSNDKKKIEKNTNEKNNETQEETKQQ